MLELCLFLFDFFWRGKNKARLLCKGTGEIFQRVGIALTVESCSVAWLELTLKQGLIALTVGTTELLRGLTQAESPMTLKQHLKLGSPASCLAGRARSYQHAPAHLRLTW